MSLEQLAEDKKAPCSPTTLRRIFSGYELPPRDVLKRIAQRCNGDYGELYELYERASEAAAEAERAAATRQPAPPNMRGGMPGMPADPRGGMPAGPEVAGYNPDYDEDFWAPMAPDEYGNTLVSRMLRRKDEDNPKPVYQKRPSRAPRPPKPPRPPSRRERDERDAERREAMRPFMSRTRPTVVAVVLLASFAIGIILATLTIGGTA